MGPYDETQKLNAQLVNHGQIVKTPQYTFTATACYYLIPMEISSQ